MKVMLKTRVFFETVNTVEEDASLKH